MRADILEIVGKSKDVTNIIVLTHNIDLIFLQSVVVRALRKCGNPKVTIFADADRAAESFQYQGKWLTGLGRSYRVVPVAMTRGFCFHPKAILLAGKESGSLLVGSGNLSFGGWRENAEVWAQYSSAQPAERPAISAFRSYLNEILEHIPLRESVSMELAEAFDSATHPWANELDAPAGLLGKVVLGPSLVDKMLQRVGAGTIQKLTICTPYFDENGEMLREIAKRCGARKTEVFIQSGRSTLLRKAAKVLPPSIKLQSVDFIRVQKDSDSEQETTRSGFMHAKYFAFEKTNSVTVFLGSANCSLAAMNIPGSSSNAELLAEQTMSPQEFEKRFLAELTTRLANVLTNPVETAPCGSYSSFVHPMGTENFVETFAVSAWHAKNKQWSIRF